MTIAAVRVMKVFRLSCRHQVASAERNIEEFVFPLTLLSIGEAHSLHETEQLDGYC